MHPLQIATKKQHCTHIFLVTHWGASASKKPGPDNSRNTPLNRHIRSCQFDHPNLLSTSIHHHLFPQCPQIIYRASETATIHSANQIDLWKTKQHTNLRQQSNMKEELRKKKTSIMRTTATWPLARAISNGVSESSLTASGSAAVQQQHLCEKSA